MTGVGGAKSSMIIERDRERESESEFIIQKQASR